MVYSGFYLGGGNVVAVTPQHVWAGLAVASGVAVHGMIVMGCAMDARYRHTFYRPFSFKRALGQLW